MQSFQRAMDSTAKKVYRDEGFTAESTLPMMLGRVETGSLNTSRQAPRKVRQSRNREDEDKRA